MGDYWDENVLNSMEDHLCSLLNQEILRLKRQETPGVVTNTDDIETIMALYEQSENLKIASKHLK